MKNLLPLVSADIGFSIANSIGDEYDPETWRKEYRHIKKVNPAIAEFIYRWSKLSKCKSHTAIMGILVYRLLESQAESDRMCEELRV